MFSCLMLDVHFLLSPLHSPSCFSSNLILLTVQLHCWAVPVHSLVAALRLCSRVASPSAGVWCRTKHEKNVIDVSAVAVRKSSTPSTDTTQGRETDRERSSMGDWEKRQKGDKGGRKKDVQKSVEERGECGRLMEGGRERFVKTMKQEGGNIAENVAKEG